MIKVTNENRAEFVSLYLEHVLNSAVLDRLVIITTDELQPHSTRLGSDHGSAATLSRLSHSSHLYESQSRKLIDGATLYLDSFNVWKVSSKLKILFPY